MNGKTPTETKSAESKKVKRKPKAASRQSDARLAKEQSKIVVRAARDNGSNTALAYIARRGKVPLADYSAWIKCLSHPMNSPAVKCPVNYNPVPSIVTSCATVPYENTVVCPAGGTKEIVFFPGHGLEVEDQSTSDNMDAVAYHALGQQINGVTYSIGPIATANNWPPTIGFIGPDGGTNPASNTTSNPAGNVALTPSTILPYTAVNNNAEHTRWKLTGLGIRLINETPEISRGGSVETVQPTSKGIPALFRGFAVNPTYQILSGDTVQKPIELSWIPRLQDLSFWHTSALQTTSSGGAAVRILVEAPALYPQTYRLYAVAHWELGGNNLLAIGNPAVHLPAVKNTFEPALEHIANSAPTVSKIGDHISFIQSIGETASRIGTAVGNISTAAKTFM